MLYSWRHNVGFLHINKTGGTSFNAYLQHLMPDITDYYKLPDRHYRMSDVLKIAPEASIWHIVTIIRHPLAQAVSGYHYWRSLSFDSDMPLCVKVSKENDFRGFVNYWFYHGIDTITYEDALLVDGVLPAYISILKLEQLADDIQRVFNLANKPQLEVLNTSEHRHYMDYYDSDLINKIETINHWVYEAGFYDKQKV